LSLAPCSPPSSTLRVGCADGLRPCLTATARGAFAKSGRDEETASVSRTKKHHWLHTIRNERGPFCVPIDKLDTFTDLHRAAQQRIRALIWNFYADLKIYRANPSKNRRTVLRARFDRIFRRRTGFVTLDRLLARLNANKAELLMVLDRPETPLHTNGSENDIRCQVTRRKVSAGTRSDTGRDCRDALLSLAKTCDKLGIAIWDYLGSRFKVAGAAIIEPLDQYVRERRRPA